MTTVEGLGPHSDSGSDAVCGTVLCIEDHPLHMSWIEELLKHFPGIRLLKAMTGRDGVQLALAEKPDLILLDMYLPDIGGLEVVRMLCEEIAVRRVAVILVTADSFSIEVIKAMSLGARDYWVKPLTMDKLRKDLPRALARAQADRVRAALR